MEEKEKERGTEKIKLDARGEKIINVTNSTVKLTKLIVALDLLKFSKSPKSKSLIDALGVYEELLRSAWAMFEEFAGVDSHQETSNRLLYLLSDAILDSDLSIPEHMPLGNSLRGFLEVLEDFSSIVLEMLSQTAEQWYHEQRFLEKCANVSPKNTAIISQLQRELPAIKDAKENQMMAKQLSEFQDNIERLERCADGEILYLREKAKNKITAIRARSEEICRELSREEQELAEIAKKAKAARLPEREAARKYIQDLRLSTEWVIGKYDEKLMDLQSQFDYVWHEFSAEMEKARDLAFEYVQVKAIFDEIKEKNWKIYYDKTSEKLYMRLRWRAATKIQRKYRSWIVRYRGVPAGKGTKGKKKKGKKGKKKGGKKKKAKK